MWRSLKTIVTIDFIDDNFYCILFICYPDFFLCVSVFFNKFLTRVTEWMIEADGTMIVHITVINNN
jgi:nucleoside recognition membrane protein YjiH